MGFKQHILSIVKNVGIGATFGYIFNYFRAYGLELPTTMEQYAQNLGMAGAISGIIGGFSSIFFPYILMPYIMRISIVRKALNWFYSLAKCA